MPVTQATWCLFHGSTTEWPWHQKPRSCMGSATWIYCHQETVLPDCGKGQKWVPVPLSKETAPCVPIREEEALVHTGKDSFRNIFPLLSSELLLASCFKYYKLLYTMAFHKTSPLTRDIMPMEFTQILLCAHTPQKVLTEHYNGLRKAQLQCQLGKISCVAQHYSIGCSYPLS